MRNRFKAIITIMVAIFVISSISFIVSAASQVDAGSVTTAKGSYTWEYFDDNTLIIRPDTYKTTLIIDKYDLPGDYLNSSTTVHIDVSNLYTQGHNKTGNIHVYGDNCPSGNIVISGSTLDNFYNMVFYNFSNLNTIRFEKETTLYWIGLTNCNVDRLDFYENLNITSLQIINSDSLISANVPDGVKKLTISSCYNLTDLNNIDELDYLSLAKVGISEIFVPKTCAYFRCNSESLTKATFEEGRTCITSFMFSGCRNLEQVIIPDGISSIETYAFDECTKLKTVYIPASINQIDRFSFGDSNNLEKVYYSGTHDQWYSITIMNEDEIIDDSIDDIFYKADIDFGVVNLITKEPEDYTGYLGSTATFTVEAEGEDLQYQWQVFKNNTWTNCSVKDGAKTDTLSLEAKESRNGSNYHCVITDKNGNTVTSNKATLNVVTLLKIETQPEDFTAAAGEMATFTVAAQGSGLKYQWQTFKNGSWTNCSINDGARTDTLSLEAKESRNGSKYQCVITDKNGNTVTTNEVKLTVATPLIIETQPEDVSGAAGEMATFTVAAQGSGLKYQWQTLKNGSWTNCSINDGAKTAKLTLAIKDSRNGSKYQCVITDKNGATVTTETVTLTVKKEVIIVTEPSDYCAYVLGETATFTIEAEGEGLKYQWQVLKNGAWTNCSINDGAKTKTLSLEVKSSRDGSEYRCVVTDKFGNSAESCTVTLTIAKALEPIRDPNDLPPIEINSVNATAAEIDFTAADCVDITEIVEVAEIVEAAEVIEIVPGIETVTDID
jgi:hypothetical protein